MSWIKLETHTFDKVEVYSIAQELGIDSDAVIGKCCRVWAWFDANTTDGVTLSVTSALLDRYCGVTGFTQAMINAGWMQDNGEFLMLPNYDRHNSKTAKSRALGAIRQSKFKSNATGNAEGNATGNERALPKSSHREEKRREEVNIYETSFLEFWSAYPKKISKPDALKAWKKIAPDDDLKAKIIDAVNVAKQSKDWTKDEGQFIPYPATWLNAKRWEDVTVTASPVKREWQEGERNGDLIYEKYIGWRKLNRIELLAEQKAKEAAGQNNAGN